MIRFPQAKLALAWEAEAHIPETVR